MVKSRKNNLHLEVSNDVDLENETASTTSRRSRKTKGKGKTLTTTKKFSLKAKPKKSGSFLVVNGKKIPLYKYSISFTFWLPSMDDIMEFLGVNPFRAVG